MSKSAPDQSIDLVKKVKEFKPEIEIRNVGTILEVGDGIVYADGLSTAQSQEIVEFENGTKGLVLSLKQTQVGISVLGDATKLSVGMHVFATGKTASVPVGKELIGRVVNALGEPIDGKGPIRSTKTREIERIAPGIVERQDVDTPLQTGILAIDAMIPIGRGQRELIIGDRQTGKTAIAIDAIINQKDTGVICIYVSIGQKKAAISRLIRLLNLHRAMEHTIIVSASADDPAALQYIAPFSGCAMGEELMESGMDAFIVYDDLSKHAWAYRQISLLLRRPPGREAYPGDVFYLHSRLLERAVRLADQYRIQPKPGSGKEKGKGAHPIFSGTLGKRNAEEYLQKLPDKEAFELGKVEGTGGSLTAIPIIETQLGDISAYVSTNVISITDGQIYLETNLFNAGIKPAINVGISVSRVGGSAQTKAMKKVGGKLRLEMANFRELASFSQIGSDLDAQTKIQLDRGLRLQELLKQNQYEPLEAEIEVVLLFAGTSGALDQIAIKDIKTWENDLIDHLRKKKSALLDSMRKTKALSSELEGKITTILNAFNDSWIS